MDGTPEEAAAEAPPAEPYYWEDETATEVPPLKVISHNLHWVGFQLFSGVEYLGEIFAEFLGMTGSRYDWAIEAAERQRVRAARGRDRAEALLIHSVMQLLQSLSTCFNLAAHGSSLDL